MRAGWISKALSQSASGHATSAAGRGHGLRQRTQILNAAECTMISNAELDRLIAELGRHPLAEGELREVKEAVFVSLNQSQPEGIVYAFCPSSGGRMHFFFRKAGQRFHLIRWLGRETDCLLARCIGDVFQFFVDVRLIYPLGASGK